MRSVIPLLLVTATAACTAAPPPQAAAPDPRAQARLAQLVDGKVAGAPESCLPSWRTHRMTVIDDSTIVFQTTPARVWVQRTQNPCNLLSAGPYALVTRNTMGQLCRGDIAQVADTMNNTTVGSCVMGDFIPYVTPGA